MVTAVIILMMEAIKKINVFLSELSYIFRESPKSIVLIINFN